MSKQKPKEKAPFRRLAGPREKKVAWNRDATDVNLPQHVIDRLQAISIEHSQVRQELDILRKTRGKRTVGTVKVPAHLSAGVPLDTRDRVVDRNTGRITTVDVERRADIPSILPAED